MSIHIISNTIGDTRKLFLEERVAVSAKSFIAILFQIRSIFEDNPIY